MRIANNVRLTAISKDHAEREAIDAAVLGLLAEKQFRAEALRKYIKHENLTFQSFDPIYKTKLWLDKQPLVRAFLQILKTGLCEQDIKELKSTIDERMDGRENISIRIDKKQFLDGKFVLHSTGDVIQLRINMAAHPKNPETVKTVFLAFLAASPDNI